MKVILSAILFLFFCVPAANAGSFSFTYDGTTGDVGLDTQIHGINIGAKGNTDGVLKELKVSFGIEIKESTRIMSTFDLSFGEMYLLVLFKQHSHMSLDEILALRKQSLGWGQIAHKLGIHPSTLNKAMRDYRKAYSAKDSGKKWKGRGKSKGKGMGKGNRK